MKIRCKCDAVIYDQTDFLSYKARIIADRDWEDFIESRELGHEFDSSLVRTCYQCTACGRLYVDDPERCLQTFVPEDASLNVLGSSRGAMWRAPLIAIWEDKPYGGGPKGSIWCQAEGGLAEDYDDWKQMENAYYALFSKLQARDVLRSSFLRKNSDFLHSWPHGEGD